MQPAEPAGQEAHTPGGPVGGHEEKQEDDGASQLHDATHAAFERGDAEKNDSSARHQDRYGGDGHTQFVYGEELPT